MCTKFRGLLVLVFVAAEGLLMASVCFFTVQDQLPHFSTISDHFYVWYLVSQVGAELKAVDFQPMGSGGLAS